MNNRTIEFFKEISKIPRESGNEKKISDYLCNFAKERNLEYRRDEFNNVLIKRKNIEKEPIILQAHMDMVCEKEEDKEIDFEKNGIEVYEENNYLMARGTSLGADNGIGIAQILNLLDDNNIKCNIEAIFTTQEETSMCGATNFDTSNLKGKYMLNLDGFEEDAIVTESACFYDIIMGDNYEYEKPKKLNFYEIKLKGLLGGHSGFDIDKDRGNANIILAGILQNLDDINIVDFKGGTKFNVIPSSSKCIINTNKKIEEINAAIEKNSFNIKFQYPNLEINLKKGEKASKCLNENSSKEFLFKISNFKHGVYFYNKNGKPTTSVNLGVVNLKEKIMKIGMRSSREEEEKKCLEELKNFSLENNLKFEILGSQPGFETKDDSELIKKLLESYPKEYDIIPKKKSVHITVEAGFFKEKIRGLEIAIISPRIEGAHTTNEKVSVFSIEKVDKWLYNFLDY